MSIKKPKYLVTGGAGFIGSNMTKYLIQETESQVRILDNFSSGKRKNIDEVSKNIDIEAGDISDYQTCLRATKDMDYIIHLAAIPSVIRSIEDPEPTHRVNITGTLNILKAAQENNVKRLIFASSSSVYGDQGSLPNKETDPLAPMNPYGFSKRIGEEYCQFFAKFKNVETVCLRYFNVFGPQQDPNSEYSAVIPKFIYRILNAQPIVIYGDGEQTRDFTYIDNIVKTNYLMSQTSKNVSGKVYNCALGYPISINQLVQKILKGQDRESQIQFEPFRDGEIKHSYASCEQLRNIIEDQKFVLFDEGIQKTMDWFQKEES